MNRVLCQFRCSVCGGSYWVSGWDVDTVRREQRLSNWCYAGEHSYDPAAMDDVSFVTSKPLLTIQGPGPLPLLGDRERPKRVKNRPERLASWWQA